MNATDTLVSEYMRLSSVFVYEDNSLFNALETMKKYEVDGISIIREDFLVIGYINKKKILEILKNNFNNNIGLLRNIKIKDLTTKHDFPIILYPGMTITEAYSTMKCFNIKCLPIVDVPWEKRIIGFLWLEDILPIIGENYIKIPV